MEDAGRWIVFITLPAATDEAVAALAALFETVEGRLGAGRGDTRPPGG